MKTKFNKDFFNEFSLCMHMTENACYIGLCSSVCEICNKFYGLFRTFYYTVLKIYFGVKNMHDIFKFVHVLFDMLMI